MAKRKTRSFRDLFTLPILIVAIAMAVVMLWKLNQSRLNQAANASFSADDFVQARGKDLVYRNQVITLRGANFDNISALGAGIGANNIDRMTITEADYQKMAEFGGNHARLGLSYTWYEQDKTKFFSILDNHVNYARTHGIWLSLLTFTNPDGNDGCYEGYSEHCSLWTNQTHQSQLRAFWRDVATRYKDNPTVVGYDLVNEPTPPGPNWCRTWFDLAQIMRNEVAAIAPNQLVFIEACSDPSFDRVFKEADGVTKARNVVYEVHDYDPMRLSHTGYKLRSSLSANDIANLPAYPGTATAWVDGVQKSFFFDKSTFEGTRYPTTAQGGGYSTAKQYSIDWARQQDVPIYIGEWGAQGWLKNHAQYIADKADIYTRLGVSHAYYTWRHSVSDGWRWGLFPTSGGFAVDSAETQQKIDAARISFASSIRPSYAAAGAMTPTPPVVSTPTPTATPVSTPTATQTPTPVPTVAPTATVRPTATPQPTPVSTPSPTTIPGKTVSGYIRIDNEWPQGYCATIVVTNNGGSALSSWKATFNLNQAKFTAKYNAKFTNLLGKITVTPNKSVSYVAPYGTNDAVDFCADKKGTNWQPTNFSVN